MSVRCDCEHPIPEGRGYCFRCGGTMGVEAERRVERDKQARREGALHLVISEVIAERTRQDDKFGGAQHDDEKNPEDWCSTIEHYVGWAEEMHRMGSPEKYRRRMRQIAAIAVAACQSFDRKREE